MRPYHPANLKLIPYPGWRIIALAWIAKFLDVQFHVHGIPFGGKYRPKRDGETDAASSRPIRVVLKAKGA